MSALLYYQQQLKQDQITLKDLCKKRKIVKKEWLATQKKEVGDRLTELNISISRIRSSIQTYKKYIEQHDN